jgi:hypothetical protein
MWGKWDPRAFLMRVQNEIATVRSSVWFLKKINYCGEITISSSNPSSEDIPQIIKTHNCTPMFTIAKEQRQRKCPTIDK